MKKKFFYSAQDRRGLIQTGVIEAPGALEAKKHLEQQGLLVLWIREKQEAGFTFSFLKRVGVQDKAIFMRQLATMLEAGFPIDKALRIIEIETKNRYFQEIISSLVSQVEAGESLSGALSTQQAVFEPVIIAVVRSGEASGKLPQALKTLAKTLEEEAKFSLSLWSALIYPIFIIVAMLVVGFLVITNFVPKIKSLFDEANAQLPWQTKVVVCVGMFLAKYWWLILLILFLFGLYIYWYVKNSKQGRIYFEKFLLSLPIVKELILISQMARLNNLFYLLLQSATPILEAIDLVADSMSFIIFQGALKNIKDKIEKGLPFSSSLAQETIFPSLESQLISVGEQTGTLENMFKRLADYYTQRAEEYVKRVVSLVEPVVIVILAFGVAIMVWSVFGPIYGLVQMPVV